MYHISGMIRRMIALMIVIAAAVMPIAAADTIETEAAEKDQDRISLIFTHDMHSHMDADKVMKNDSLTYTGGFARLKSAMDEVKKEYPQSFVLDAGDFSMGTPYQTIFSEEASELKMMKYLGYEATTFGNHEFDYRAGGLASMLNAAEGSGPQLVSANIDWNASLADDELKGAASDLKDACTAYGMKDYTVLDHNGTSIAVFGIMGENAVDYAPESGLIFKDAVETAGNVVDEIKSEENVDMIVCLSHCGTIENEEDSLEETEDYRLAEEVPDIDVIISGHSHTVLDEPVTVGSTYIVSCGSYNKNMGHLTLNGNDDGYEIEEYELIPLDETIDPDESVNNELDKFRKLADKEYFSRYGFSVDQVIAKNSIDFTPIEEFGTVQGEDALGNLIADSYKYAVAEAEGCRITGYEDGGAATGQVTCPADSSIKDEDGRIDSGVDITVVPSGVVRGSLFKGNVTAGDAFNIMSLGYGSDGSPGYPLVRVYLTGKELRDAAEVDASVSNFMGVARLYVSGLDYSWNDSRLILNRAVDIKFNDGKSQQELEDDRLYSVVADLYSCQMLGSVKAKSFGLLKIEPKDSEGDPVTDFEEHIIYDGDKELKAWYALASYIDSFEDDQIPEYYSGTHGRKTEISSISPVEMLKQPNRVAAAVAVVVIVLAAVVTAAVMIIKKLRRRKKEKKQ